MVVYRPNAFVLSEAAPQTGIAFFTRRLRRGFTGNSVGQPTSNVGDQAVDPWRKTFGVSSSVEQRRLGDASNRGKLLHWVGLGTVTLRSKMMCIGGTRLSAPVISD
jgi:hypothetical protein